MRILSWRWELERKVTYKNDETNGKYEAFLKIKKHYILTELMLIINNIRYLIFYKIILNKNYYINNTAYN